MGVKYRIKKFLRHGVTSDEYIRDLKSKGVTIGKGTVFFSPLTTTIDVTRPYLVSIGEYTKITGGVIVLTHDYSLSVLRRKYGEWIGEGAETIIGDNCFIGMNSIILMGSRIGNNVIVGAGSVVHGDIPDNVVVAGNPARIICTLDEHYKKRLERSKKEAINCAIRFEQIYGKKPTPVDMQGFKFLFCPRDEKILSEYGLSFCCNGDEPDQVKRAFYNTEPEWNDFDDFLEDVDRFKTGR